MYLFQLIIFFWVCSYDRISSKALTPVVNNDNNPNNSRSCRGISCIMPVYLNHDDAPGTMSLPEIPTRTIGAS